MKAKISIIDDKGDHYEGEVELSLVQKTQNKKNKVKLQDKENFKNIDINIPEEIIENITNLDERIQFPILWYFSTQPIMSVNEFLNACADKGLTLNPSWHTSAGGNFKNRLVKEDKMFTQVKNIESKEKVWKLTDVGKLKIKKQVNDLRKKS